MAKSISDAILSYKKSILLATQDSKNPQITEKEIETAIATTEENIYEGVTFKVQLAASSRELELQSYNFKGLRELSMSKEGNLYKYYYGETSDYNKIQLMKTYAQEKGYDSCYIVAFKDGKKQKLSSIINSN